MPNIATTFLILTIIVICLPSETYAFGAGDIPDFAYLNDKAFRHGDIENILINLAKTTGKVGGASGLFGFAQQLVTQAAGGSKFNKSDIKKVYFGNWLRDYSQAMDIAGLSKLTADTLVLVVSVLGFMTFGFATEEFQVTADRLGVYLPVEHIDNPKGYAEKEGDARQYHPKLRPPVDPRELEIDERTGMKNYIATEGQSWDTSTAHIRRVFRACIDHGRRARGREGADLWEAYRLLGTGLHTMEDLLAHSNWCELALRKMGHEEVFCHVGERVLIDTPNGRAPPLITGTFGSADFLHSLLGEATDHLSQASVTDLSAKMNNTSQNDNSQLETLKGLLSKLPIGGGDDKVNKAESIHAASKAYNFDPNNVAPPEVQQQLLELLKWRDDIYRDVLEKIEMVPGLSDLIDGLTDALNAYVYTVLAPWLTPILQQATGVLGEGSKAVIDSDDQYAVFDNPNASDPSHSLLSKDHFGLILNEPAGKIAQLVVENSVGLIVNAWFDDNQNPDNVITQILEAFHHPYYATGRSRIQHEMFELMEKWIGGLGPEEAAETLQALTKDSVRNGKNKRLGSDDAANVEPGYGPSTTSYGSSGGQQGHYGGSGRGKSSYGDNNGEYSEDRNNGQSEEPNSNAYVDAQNWGGGRSSGRGGYEAQETRYGGQAGSTEGYSYGRQSEVEQPSYERGDGEGYGSKRNRQEEEPSYGRAAESDGYGSSGRRYQQEEQPSYGRTEESEGYGSRRTRQEEQPSYESRNEESEGYGSRRHHQQEEQTSYGSRNEESEGYGSRRHHQQEQPSYGYRKEESEGYGSSYRRQEEQPSYASRGEEQQEYGSRRHHEDEEPSYEQPSYASRNIESESYGRRENSGYAPSYQSEARSGGYGTREETAYGGASEYGGGRRDAGYGEGTASYGGEERNAGYGREERSSGYGSEERGSYGEEREQVYGGGEDSGETFGAERLNINEEEEGGYGRQTRNYEDSY